MLVTWSEMHFSKLAEILFTFAKKPMEILFSAEDLKKTGRWFRNNFSERRFCTHVCSHGRWKRTPCPRARHCRRADTRCSRVQPCCAGRCTRAAAFRPNSTSIHTRTRARCTCTCKKPFATLTSGFQFQNWKYRTLLCRKGVRRQFWAKIDLVNREFCLFYRDLASFFRIMLSGHIGQ